MKRTKETYILLLGLAALLGGCAAPSAEKNAEPAEGMIAVTDSVGRLVEVPEEPQSICCICPFAGPLVVMFDEEAPITSICNNMRRSNLLEQIYPGMTDKPVAKSSGSVNAETILELKTDLIFVDSEVWEDDAERAKLDSLGIPYVTIGFTNIEEQMDAVRVVGRALGTEEEAESYLTWYQDVIDEVSEECAKIPAEERPRIYHSVNESLRTDYEGSICAEWIAYTGAENVALDGGNLSFEGDQAFTTMEQIYEWNPELIICNEPGTGNQIRKDKKWAGLACVQADAIYQIPVGISRMGHPTSTETPLATLWLAELLYPERFDIDFAKEVKDFYKTYYNYELSDEMTETIIKGDQMRKKKTGTTGGL